MRLNIVKFLFFLSMCSWLLTGVGFKVILHNTIDFAISSLQVIRNLVEDDYDGPQRSVLGIQEFWLPLKSFNVTAASKNGCGGSTKNTNRMNQDIHEYLFLTNGYVCQNHQAMLKLVRVFWFDLS